MKDFPGTFGKIALEWLEDIRPEIKESSFAQYCFIVERHLQKEFGDTLLKNMTAIIHIYTS